MMDWTDQHCRYFHRLLSRNTLLYTEMITTGALLHGDYERLLAFDAAEHPVALQIGGSNPEELAKCARLIEHWGYDEVNLNCGCPSDRVQNGAFGACLMREPGLVADCISAMIESCGIPVTVKCRIGVDDQDEYEDLQSFVSHVAEAGCKSIAVHARKAWLQGLSPKQNRDIPPLNYARVYALKQDFPHMEVIINGGITDLHQAEKHLAEVDGVMMGRSAYQNPWLLAEVDRRFFQEEPRFQSPLQVLEALYPYIQDQLDQGEKLASMTRHILGLFQGRPGTRQFKRFLSENAYKTSAGIEVLQQAAEHLTETQLEVEA